MSGSAEGWRGKRRVRLLEAAARVFAGQSYGQASMDEIAQAAGVGKPTLYRYFPSKEALFAAVFARALDELEERMAAVLAGHGGVAAQLHALIVAMLPTVRDHLVALRFLGEDAALADQSKRRVFRERRARIAGFLEHAIQDGIDRGEVRPIAAGRTAHLIIGMIWSGTARTPADEDDALARDIAGLVLDGIVQHGIVQPGAERAGALRIAGITSETGAAWQRSNDDQPADPDRGRPTPKLRTREATP